MLFRSNTHPKEIGILAVVLLPLSDFFFVGAFDGTRVDDVGFPAVPLVAVGAVVEVAGVERRVSELEPEDFRVTISQCSSSDFGGDDGGDFRSLIHDNHNALALVVSTGESLRVFFGPGNKIATPVALVFAITTLDRGYIHLPLFFRQRHAKPFIAFGLGFCVELPLRSEERPVGKECRSRWPPY